MRIIGSASSVVPTARGNAIVSMMRSAVWVASARGLGVRAGDDELAPTARRDSDGNAASTRLDGMTFSPSMNRYPVLYQASATSPATDLRMRPSTRKKNVASKLFNIRGYESLT